MTAIQVTPRNAPTPRKDKASLAAEEEAAAKKKAKAEAKAAAEAAIEEETAAKFSRLTDKRIELGSVLRQRSQARRA